MEKGRIWDQKRRLWRRFKRSASRAAEFLPEYMKGPHFKHREVQRRAVASIRAGKLPDVPVLVFSTRRFATGRQKRRKVGGFADRMKGIVSMYLLALATDRAFFIDWTHPGRLQENLRPGVIQWKPPRGFGRTEIVAAFTEVSLLDHELTAKRRELIRSGDIEDGLFGNSKHVICRCNHFIHEEIRSGNLAARLTRFGIDLSGPETCFRSAFDKLFVYQPGDEVRALLDEFLAWKARQPRVVGVQIRTGGDGEWIDPVFLREAHWERVCGAIVERLRSGRADTGVFVATDSARFKVALRQAIPASFPVWSLEGSIIHFERSSRSRGSDQSALVVLENTILSRCDEILTGTGDFGRVAAWRGGMVPTRVV